MTTLELAIAEIEARAEATIKAKNWTKFRDILEASQADAPKLVKALRRAIKELPNCCPECKVCAKPFDDIEQILKET